MASVGIAAETPRTPPHNYGRFGDQEAVLRALRDRLVAALSPSEIRLFGSRAQGSNSPDSDFDLLVIFDDERGETSLDYDRVYAPLLGLGIGCDVIPCLAGDFAAEREIPGTVCHAAAHGRLIYSRDG